MGLTAQQTAAVEAEGNVLVMAGAGTGKTSTLVARVAARLIRPTDPVRADRILMVTFTEAAAQEMRARLRKELESVPTGEGGVPAGLLADQLARLELATIGTLHGFCLQLLREHGTLAGLEPQVAVLDEVESGRIADLVWRRRVEAWLADDGPEGAGFRELATEWFDGDIQALRETVWGVLSHARTLPDPTGWYTEQEALWAEDEPTAWRTWLEEYLPEWARQWAERLAGAVEIPAVRRRVDILLDGLPGAGAGRAAWFAGLAENDDEYTKRRKTVERAPLVKFFAELEFLAQLERDGDGPDPLAEDWGWCRGAMRTLLATVRGYDEAFAAEKRARGGVDFQDLEQFALDLLVRKAVGVAQACRERFELVVVDECQDLNGAQEAILRAVSREGPDANRFLVGDVKQSIYRFRLADPHLFQATAERWSQPGADGRVFPLTGNFRSAESILRFANTVCARLFRREVGGVTYGPEAALEFGDPAGRAALASGNDGFPRVEWHVGVRETSRSKTAATPAPAEVSSPGNAGPEAGEIPPVAVEARRVAARLRAVHESGLQVWDRTRKEMRRVEWRDMAVLLRAEKGRVDEFAAEFRAAGVPLVSRQKGFFLLPAVSDLRSLLRILDNPLQDIPLVAVLRSPLVGMTDPDELAVLRLFDRSGDLAWWTLLNRFVEVGQLPREESGADAGGTGTSGPDVFRNPATAPAAGRALARAARFLAAYASWRRIAIRSGAAAALEAALDDTGYERWAASVPDAGETVGNVRRLLEMARQFDRGSRGGLYRFLVWLDGEEAADRMEPASSSGRDAVQLMTVHRSKGLEFPVVAVAGLGTRFQMMDLNAARVVRDEKLGLCPLVVAPSGRRYPSLALWLAQRRQRREVLGEELRLLYVALTRAADLLLLFGTATPKDLEEHWPAAAARLDTVGGPMPVLDVEDATAPLDWVGPVLSRIAGADWGDAEEGVGDGFVWRVARGVPGVPPVPVETAQGPVSEPGEGPVWLYPHAGATEEPAKVTATGLRRRMAEEDGLEVGRRAFGMRHGASDPRDGSAVDRGIALHRFMELVDPGRTRDEAQVRDEMARMVGAGLMTQAEVDLLDVSAVARFWATELGVLIRDRVADLRREIPFTVRLTAADLRTLGFRVAADLAPDEFVVGQGVVDLALVGPDGIVILDFKTDRVGGGASTRKKAEAYRPQLAVYALALARIHGRRVTGRWLHFLETGETIEV